MKDTREMSTLNIGMLVYDKATCMCFIGRADGIHCILIDTTKRRSEGVTVTEMG
jgi:hypothetical protein